MKDEPERRTPFSGSIGSMDLYMATVIRKQNQTLFRNVVAGFCPAKDGAVIHNGPV